jgi:YVTN family beta-propeller protein
MRVRRRSKIILLFALVSTTLLVGGCRQPQATTRVSPNIGLRTIADIPMSGGTNRWDYQSINYDNNRLYISHLGSSIVTVFDLKSQQVIADISDIAGPFGILAVPNLKTVYVSSAGRVGVIDDNTLKVTKYIQAGTTPDGIAFDPNTNKVFVSNENSGTITVIDAKTNERLEDIIIGGRVGNTQFDPVSKLIYSVSDADKLFEIDPSTDKVVNRYNVTGGSQPHGFYIDEATPYA